MLAGLSAGCSVNSAPKILADASMVPAQIRTDLPPKPLLDTALAAYRRVESAGLVRTRLLTVIDYSRPSSEKRLWILEPASLQVLHFEFVAHGKGSTDKDKPEVAVRFGNENSSLRTSLGTFVTGSTYIGKHGRSLELNGLDPGVNDKALQRRIVIHPADYMSAKFRSEMGGRVGRSFGCPALDPAVAPEIITRIQDGSVLYASAGITDPAPAFQTATLSSGQNH